MRGDDTTFIHHAVADVVSRATYGGQPGWWPGTRALLNQRAGAIGQMQPHAVVDQRLGK